MTGIEKSHETPTLRPKRLRSGAAAAYLGVSPETLRRWADDEFIPCLRTKGGHRLFAQADLDALNEDMQS